MAADVDIKSLKKYSFLNEIFQRLTVKLKILPVDSVFLDGKYKCDTLLKVAKSCCVYSQPTDSMTQHVSKGEKMFRKSSNKGTPTDLAAAFFRL